MKALCLAGIAACVGLGLLCVAWGQGPGAAQGAGKVVQQWEYDSVSGENLGKFNELGAQGWELCATTSPTPTQTSSFIFKRPKPIDVQAAVPPPGLKIWGTWEHTFPADPDRRQVKVINRTHFLWVTYNRPDGTPLVMAGGTYSIDDKNYKEKVEFGGPGLPAELVGKEQTFTADVVDGKWNLTGTLSNGIEINEIWNRVK
jgi:hypothetical protein